MSVWQAVVARRARANALSQRDRAMKAEADALAQRDRAETHLRQAREAVDQMLTEVGQETLSRVPHMEPVRRALLEKALGFYEKFLVQEGDDPAIRLEAGRAYRRVGEIRRLLGQNDRASEAYRSSIELLGGLVASRPSDLDCRRELAESHINLAGSLFKTGKTTDAESEYRRAIELRRDVLERSSGDPDDRLAWAEAQWNLRHVPLLHRSSRRGARDSSCWPGWRSSDWLPISLMSRDTRASLARILNDSAPGAARPERARRGPEPSPAGRHASAGRPQGRSAESALSRLRQESSRDAGRRSDASRAAN